MAVGQALEVCVVAYGSASFVDSWLAGSRALSACLAVADNEKGSPTLRALGQASDFNTPAVRSLALEHNPGFGAACNSLAATSDATWLLLLNPDAKVVEWPTSPDFPTSGTIYGAQQLRPSGDRIHSSGKSWTVRDEIAVAWLRKHPEPPSGVGYVSGGAMLVEREVFLKLGGFDEGFFLFYEDIDLCLRAGKMGTAVSVDPDFVVHHELGHSARQDWESALRWSFESGEKFHRKHRNGVRRYRLFVVVDSFLRSFFFAATREPQKSRAHRVLGRKAVARLLRS
jgi:N-acetylglucosaminyl-diphospho-decaprenol L-rhamnosyltransferase